MLSARAYRQFDPSDDKNKHSADAVMFYTLQTNQEAETLSHARLSDTDRFFFDSEKLQRRKDLNINVNWQTLSK